MKDLSHEVKTFALGVYGAIGTPLAKRLARAVELGDWDTVAECKVDPRAYSDPQEYFLDASSASLLRKLKCLPSNHDRRGAALANWKLGEDHCFKTNERLAPYLEGRTHPDFRWDVYQHIAGIRKKIETVLGPRPPAMEALRPKHGPGATFSDPSVRSTVADKMEVTPSITNSALWFLLDWIGTAWGREASARGVSPAFVRGNRFSVAPKDATKDRAIAAEPSVNIFYQLALGDVVRRRLKKVGIDLDDGAQIHRRKACEASTAGHLATLDLKNASDTVAFNLVRLLLPPAWFELFNELRSPFTRMADRDLRLLMPQGVKRRSADKRAWVRLEKFSSMGNGFTFELETLLFWAITDHAVQACGVDHTEQTLVFGDDIICDNRCVRAVTAALRFFGFTLNEEKSFASGPFRESCGGDFWNGRPVRPIFLKEPLDEPQQLIAAANQVRKLGKDLFGGPSPLDRVWHALQLRLPLPVRRCRGPEGLGDVVIHDEESRWGWTSERRDRVFCYRPIKYRKVTLRPFADGTLLACGLYGIEVDSGWINPRDSVAGYGIRKVMVYGIDWVPTQPVRPHWNVPEDHPAGLRRPDYSRAYRVAVNKGVLPQNHYEVVWEEVPYWH